MTENAEPRTDIYSESLQDLAACIRGYDLLRPMVAELQREQYDCSLRPEPQDLQFDACCQCVLQVGRTADICYAPAAACEGVFMAITLDIESAIDEIWQLSKDWASARTRLAGTVTMNATGDAGPEANQALFLLRRAKGRNRQVARYIFSTTNPLQRQDHEHRRQRNDP